MILGNYIRAFLENVMKQVQFLFLTSMQLTNELRRFFTRNLSYRHINNPKLLSLFFLLKICKFT